MSFVASRPDSLAKCPPPRFAAAFRRRRLFAEFISRGLCSTSSNGPEASLLHAVSGRLLALAAAATNYLDNSIRSNVAREVGCPSLSAADSAVQEECDK